MRNMRRREFITLLGGAAAWPLAARAQQTERGARLGFLGSTSPTAQVYVERVEAFRTALRDLGYIEGKNLVLEFRWANGDYARLPELAAELLRLDMDVLVTFGTPGTLAAKRASAKIPIVMAVSGDAVASGIISSLARPGGNITGSTFLNPELVAKRFDLAKETLPSIARVAFLFNPDNPLDRVDLLQSAIKTAQTLNVELETVATRMPEEISAALSAMKSRHIDAVTATDDSMFFSHAAAIAEASVQNRLALFGSVELAQAGALIGYGPDITALYRRAATFVDKIIKGAKPADIPVEQPTKFKLVINVKTAKALGLTIPDNLLSLADEVIE
jgi:putative tryptophan/tyrosine transport system substrate-binding protein